MRTATVSPAAVDALLEQWNKQNQAIELVRDLCVEALYDDPSSEIAALVLIATKLDEG